MPTARNAISSDHVVSVILTGPQFPALSSVVTDESCQGAMDGAVDLTVTGGTGPFSYLWSTSSTAQDLTGLGGGTYSVEVTDGLGCVHADTAVVAAGTPVPPANIAPVSGFCMGDAPSVLAATPAGGSWSGTGIDPLTGVPYSDKSKLVAGLLQIFWAASASDGSTSATSAWRSPRFWSRGSPSGSEGCGR